jgi:penicillin-binding protein 2
MDAAIMRSNDTYFYDLAHKLGIDRLHDYMAMFGLGEKVSLDMFEESAGLMPSRNGNAPPAVRHGSRAKR